LREILYTVSKKIDPSPEFPSKDTSKAHP